MQFLRTFLIIAMRLFIDVAQKAEKFFVEEEVKACCKARLDDRRVKSLVETLKFKEIVRNLSKFNFNLETHPPILHAALCALSNQPFPCIQSFRRKSFSTDGTSESASVFCTSLTGKLQSLIQFR